MVNNQFLQQEATNIILQNVTRYCAECYKEFKEEESLYYDMKNYRYLCQECAKRIEQELPNDLYESIEVNKEATLF